MTQIRDLVKDPQWQKIRKEMVGKWISDPTWCCLQLSSYLGNIQNAPTEKLRIVGNYLVGSGFRMGKIQASCAKALRTQVFLEIRKRKGHSLGDPKG